MSFLKTLGVAIAAVAMGGCGKGQALIKEVEPLEPGIVAKASDDRIAATIDAVIVRNARGAWASDADWDEYLVRVRSSAAAPVTITQAAVVDALGAALPARAKRSELIDGSRDVESRYGLSGQLVKTEGSGWAVAGGAALIGVGAAATGASVVGAYMGAATYGGTAAGTASAAAAGPALVIVGGVLIGAAIVRAVNNSRVNDELKRRATRLPLVLEPGSEAVLDVFVPLTPLPRAFELVYADGQGERRLRIDTGVALALVHREKEQPALVYGPEPRYPKEAMRAGIENGWVKAKLVVDGGGTPRRVSLTEASIQATSKTRRHAP